MNTFGAQRRTIPTKCHSYKVSYIVFAFQFCGGVFAIFAFGIKVIGVAILFFVPKNYIF